MKNDSYKRIYQSQEYLSPLGRIEYRALFGGYSLAIEETVFAMVAEGELYLRVCEQSAPYRVSHPTPLLTLRKRGRPVLLNYYHVDDTLWGDRHTLLTLSSHSLEEAQREKDQRYDRRGLKNLPNITFHMELMLFEAGICDHHMLFELGAELSWLKLREKRKGINVSVLFALEGAIAGVHAAALPAQLRQELMEWVNSLPGSPLPLQEKRAAGGDLSPGEA
ncbi:TfoX/Sxy family DNA transformation protein [Trabulsiella guamensis]|uniref:TfoX/Sxy family DNA transformation protein n=1 Tax=Trabulsiella guamensis TaxID=158852 RepID=UPI000907CB6B|nr:TfoX/Sxy family DNA transformation protein [Trabulsiella guamensis]